MCLWAVTEHQGEAFTARARGRVQQICLENPHNSIITGPLANYWGDYMNDVYCISASPHWGSLFKQFHAQKSRARQDFGLRSWGTVDGAVGVMLQERDRRLFLGCLRWKQGFRCPAHSSILPDLLGPQPAPCWTLCCACTAIWLQMDKKRGISRRLSKRFLKTLWWDSKGSYSAWISPELFGMLQVIDSLISLVLKLNWVLWSN